MYRFKTQGVCSQSITFDIVDGKVHDVSFEGGCNGNLKAIGILVEGRPVEEVASLLAGNTCGPRSTSCTDQLSRALRAAEAQIAKAEAAKAAEAAAPAGEAAGE